MLSTPATHGGKQCEAADLVDLQPCNTAACGTDHPIDATWGAWSTERERERERPAEKRLSVSLGTRFESSGSKLGSMGHRRNCCTSGIARNRGCIAAVSRL